MLAASPLQFLAFFAPLNARSRLVPMRSYLRLADFGSAHFLMSRAVWHYTQHVWLGLELAQNSICLPWELPLRWVGVGAAAGWQPVPGQLAAVAVGAA